MSLRGGSVQNMLLSESGSVTFEDAGDDEVVLVVDDDLLTRKVLHRWLSVHYEVHLAASGEEGWRKLQQGGYDLVLVDKEMPGMSGLDLLEKVVENDLGVPVLLMSAVDKSDSTASAALAKGGEDYIFKPLVQSLLLSRVRKTLDFAKSMHRERQYKEVMREKLSQVRRLERQASANEVRVTRALEALETPLSGVIKTLSSVLSKPELQNTGVREQLESVLQTMMQNKDLYRPVVDKMRASNALDPIASSLLEQYTSERPNSRKSSAASRGSAESGQPRKRKDSIQVQDADHLHKLVVDSGLTQWSFDCWAYEDEAELVQLLFAMFHHFRLVEAFELNEKKLQAFLSEVRTHYDDNPYHNFRHAFDVTQTLFSLLTEFKLGSIFMPLELLAMLLAAICHDIEHPGVNNRYLIDTDHDYALTFNDKSVLENHHCRIAFQLMRNDEFNFLEHLPRSTYRELRHHMIACILSTDMAVHFSKAGKLEQLAKNAAVQKWEESEERTFLMEVLVHTADISNVAKPWDTSYRWSNRVTKEFFEQGDREKKLGLDVEPFMDRSRATLEQNTVNFLRFVCLSFFGSLPYLFPQTRVIVKTAEENLKRWTIMLKEKEDAAKNAVDLSETAELLMDASDSEDKDDKDGNDNEKK